MKIRAVIISKVKTELNSFKDLKLTIANQSIAGFIALSKKVANIKDVYDERELRALSPQLHFQKEVDKRTGYRTKQMLVAPILSSNDDDELLGVVQLLNSKTNEPFSQAAVDGVNELCQTLAIAFSQRQKSQQTVKSKYDHLVTDAVVSSAELDLATRSARRKGYRA